LDAVLILDLCQIPIPRGGMAAEEAPASESWSIDRDLEVCLKASVSSTTIRFCQQDKRQG